LLTLLAKVLSAPEARQNVRSSSRPWARAQSVRDTGQEPSSKLQQRRVAILGVDLGIHAHHHGFQGPQYGPQLYSEASSLICAASNWSCAIDCCNPSCL